METNAWIRIRGARQNNLKNIDVDLPKNQLVVVTGPSGAGKSSLAFDTLYAEGQRRYVESLSPAARQFLTQMDKPAVDAIEGLGPAIAVQQQPTRANPRSTVGTVSDIYDFLRLLFARVATPHCHNCGKPIHSHTVQQVVDAALARKEARRLLVVAPREYDPILDWGEVLAGYRREGFARIRLRGQIHGLEEDIPNPGSAATATDSTETINTTDATNTTNPEVELGLVIDRLSLANADRQRLTEAVEQAYHFGSGRVQLVFLDGDQETTESYSCAPRCADCGITYPEPRPRLFSFNSPTGACPDCHGLGCQEHIDPARVVPDPGKTLAQGAIAPWHRKNSPAFQQLLQQVAEHYGFSIFEPFHQLSAEHQHVLLNGSGSESLMFGYGDEDNQHHYQRPFEGVIASLERRYRESKSASLREELRRYMSAHPCESCRGARLRRESLHYRLGEHSIAQVAALPLDLTHEWATGLDLEPMAAHIAAEVLHEIRRRLGFLINVGLSYLALDRTLETLSSGEAQRILLATQIGSALSGVIYILDEPTIGLHQRDTERLLGTLEALRDAGNTVVVVEHDAETLARADYLVEIGPKAGEYGGELVAAGTARDLMEAGTSITGRYLAGQSGIPVPSQRRKPGEQRLIVRGACAHNLQHVDAEFPLGLLVCVTGVSGSGKSTLLIDTLYPALKDRLAKGPVRLASQDPELAVPRQAAIPLKALEGVGFLDRIVHVDQSPVGRTTRSNPATYLGIFARIRDHFAAIPESRARGYTARRFSFNVPGGRCEACQGEGTRRIEMHFLPDIFVRCDACDGARYNRETLEIRYRGRTIAGVLDLTVAEAATFFHALPAIRTRLEPLLGVGLDYLRLGQSAATLSGGEAQRLKIARELGRHEAGRTLYLLDEPTTGLHVDDVARLLDVLNQLVDQGHSVVLIEHNLDVIKSADYLIDLGPEAGAAGGRVIASGTPEDLVRHAADSPTGRYLAHALSTSPPEPPAWASEKGHNLHSSPPRS